LSHAKDEEATDPDTDSVVIVLNPDLNGKCFIARRIEVNDGAEIQVWIDQGSLILSDLPTYVRCKFGSGSVSGSAIKNCSLGENCHTTDKSEAIVCARSCRTSSLKCG
jgi:hypothetical protein